MLETILKVFHDSLCNWDLRAYVTKLYGNFNNFNGLLLEVEAIKSINWKLPEFKCYAFIYYVMLYLTPHILVNMSFNIFCYIDKYLREHKCIGRMSI